MKEVSNRLGFPQMEEKILNFWRKENIFQKSIDERPEDKTFSFMTVRRLRQDFRIMDTC